MPHFQFMTRCCAQPVAGLVVLPLAAGGLLCGLLVLRCLLWALALPVALPYAAMAGLYRSQLHSTTLMWRAMRGKGQLPLLRVRLLNALRRRGRADGSFAALDRYGSSPGSGLKQLSGSMLLFMPLLLLLPTTAWFYFFSFGLHAAGSLPRAVLQLFVQLVHDSAAEAAAQHLLESSSSSSTSSTNAGQYQYQLFEPHIDTDALPAAAADGVRCTTYLLARRQQGSCWSAAMHAVAQAMAKRATMSPARVCLDVLTGRPLWLAWPGWCSD